MKMTRSNPQTLILALNNANKEFGGNLEFKRFDSTTKSTNFTLRVRDSKGKGAKRGFSGKRTVAACAHAHYSVLAKLFELAPGAKVSSAMATFDGAAQFLANADYVGDKNVGSAYQPRAYGDMCDCERV